MHEERSLTAAMSSSVSWILRRIWPFCCGVSSEVVQEIQ